MLEDIMQSSVPTYIVGPHSKRGIYDTNSSL
jgi:hypothetical protein